MAAHTAACDVTRETLRARMLYRLHLGTTFLYGSVSLWRELGVAQTKP